MLKTATLEVGRLFEEIDHLGVEKRLGELQPLDVAFPVAAGVFYPYVISPAAIAMSGSSALVAVNALLLKRTRLEGVSRTPPAEPGTDRPVEATA